ncbi:Chaperone protein HtpG [hydrothermal vent metagenome]|uniref:Chaperone protein HtpG n=1 Tax=hydrothermal vent metagenome TaxID=652676 RepID=A0A3B1E5R7_9ZZZZ
MAKHEFQTEVGQLLKLMTHSLYSNKEIFIRELVSNCSDALDKLEYLKLTDDQLKGYKTTPVINIKIDEEDKSITITDNGIGMNEKDLIASIGTIAKSGTKSFVDAMSGDAKKDSNLIGQFGVGFYSVFMVADKVDVISKKAGEEQAFKWSSDGTGSFDLSSCTKDESGTVIYIKLKDEEVSDYTSKYKVENVVKKYSNHIAYPIFLNYTEEVTETLSEEDKKAKKEPKKTIEKKHEQINEATALWTQAKAKLKKDDYNEFYKSISHDSETPMAYVHTRAEGVNNYTTLFYIPQKAPMDMYRVDFQPGVKLYVKRVFITDDEKELLPTYLRFVKGIIDSDDLPLNVSRELLQENKVMANIKQASIKKILSEIKKISKDEEKYEKFIAEYNRPLKEGVYQDYTNKDAILELVRYKSTNNKEKMTSLSSYKERASTDQKTIFYIVGDDEKVLRNSPLIESYKKNNIEVLILDDREVDEVVTPAIGSYKDWDLKDISSCEAPKTEQSEEEVKKVEEKFKSIVEKIKNVLGEAVKNVKTTNRLSDSPSCVVKDPNDPMAQMAAMMKQMGQEVPESVSILEINPDHKIVKKLNNCSDNDVIETISWLLLDQAKMAEGVDIKDPVSFVSRLNKVIEKSL